MEKPVEKIMTYIGRRIQKGRLFHCFEQKGEEGFVVWYPKVKASKFYGCEIGQSYKLDDVIPQIWSKAKIGQLKTINAEKWQVQDRTAEMLNRQKSIKSSPQLDTIVDRLKVARRHLSPAQKPAFDAWLLNQIKT